MKCYRGRSFSVTKDNGFLRFDQTVNPKYKFPFGEHATEIFLLKFLQSIRGHAEASVNQANAQHRNQMDQSQATEKHGSWKSEDESGSQNCNNSYTWRKFQNDWISEVHSLTVRYGVWPWPSSVPFCQAWCCETFWGSRSRVSTPHNSAYPIQLSWMQVAPGLCWEGGGFWVKAKAACIPIPQALPLTCHFPLDFEVAVLEHSEAWDKAEPEQVLWPLTWLGSGPHPPGLTPTWLAGVLPATLTPFGEFWATPPCVSQSVKSAPSSEGGCGPRDGEWGLPCAPAPQDWSGSQRQPPAPTCTCHRILWAHQSPSSTEIPTSSLSTSRSCSTRLSSVMGTAMDSQARLSQGGLWDVKSTGPEDGGRAIRLLILYTESGSGVFFFFFKWSVTRFHLTAHIPGAQLGEHRSHLWWHFGYTSGFLWCSAPGGRNCIISFGAWQTGAQ